MANKVVKFGGSSLVDAAQFRKVAAIIHAEDARRYGNSSIIWNPARKH